EGAGGALGQLADLDAVRADHLDRLNRLRRDADRPPLRASAALDRTAQAYAERMLREGFYGHVSPDGGDVMDRVQAMRYPARAAGENLGTGQRTLVRVIDDWLDSPPHRANLLNRSFREVGLGVIATPGDDGPTVLWVQVFGTPR
ncbi:MAG: CAP domain-containing protein, partial [Acidobacteriota bacterium]